MSNYSFDGGEVRLCVTSEVVCGSFWMIFGAWTQVSLSAPDWARYARVRGCGLYVLGSWCLRPVSEGLGTGHDFSGDKILTAALRASQCRGGLSRLGQ